MIPAPVGLHALLRQAGARRPPPVAATETAPRARADAPDVARLRQLLRVRAPHAIARRASAWDRALPGAEIAPGLRLVERAFAADGVPDTLAGGFDRRADFDPRRVLFFDTETTGLAGGTGTRAFMIGAAQWRGGELCVRQLFITSLAAEPAMLTAFADWIEPDALLVSYNGKSYDAPLLRTRYRLARMRDPLAQRDHIDLLYPARRRYRGRFENCRLATIERRVLDIVREDDLPGSAAPAAWLTYLRSGPARDLARVAAHNQQDVASLARLLRHLAALPDAALR